MRTYTTKVLTQEIDKIYKNLGYKPVKTVKWSRRRNKEFKRNYENFGNLNHPIST